MSAHALLGHYFSYLCFVCVLACQAAELLQFVNEVTYNKADLHFIMGDFNADPFINPSFYGTKLITRKGFL